MTVTTKLEKLENLYKRAEAKWYNAMALAVDAHAATGQLFSKESDVADEAGTVAWAAFDKWQEEATR